MKPLYVFAATMLLFTGALLAAAAAHRSPAAPRSEPPDLTREVALRERLALTEADRDKAQEELNQAQKDLAALTAERDALVADAQQAQAMSDARVEGVTQAVTAACNARLTNQLAGRVGVGLLQQLVQP